jgi:hypothetical protein
MRLSEIPNEPHFAILRTTSVTIPGDERSRSHPGHGYPESTETYITYQVFTDRAKWEEVIRYETERHSSFRAIYVNPAKVETIVKVGVT